MGPVAMCRRGTAVSRLSFLKRLKIATQTHASSSEDGPKKVRTRLDHICEVEAYKLIIPGTPIYLPKDLRGEKRRALASSERWWLRSIALTPAVATCLPLRCMAGSSADESIVLTVFY